MCLHTRRRMYCVALVAQERHLVVMRCVVKGVFFGGFLPAGGMALEARTCAQSVTQMGGFLEHPHKIRHRIASSYGFDDHFIRGGCTDMAVNAFDVLVTLQVVRCGQGKPLAL